VQTENENPAMKAEPVSDGIESAKESTLEWLLELDRDEPQENLFVVDRREPVNLELSAFEAEIAARPMIRGRAGADDFDTYVGEEIVISSEGTSSDIYNDSSLSDVDDGDDLSFDEAMALDFTHRDSDWADVVHAEVEDGADILGIEEEDDSGIGDAFLVVRREPKAAQPAAGETGDSVEPEVVADRAESILSAVTPRVGALMDELGVALAARLKSLGRPVDAVYTEFSLATDDASVALAIEQGYASIGAICKETPESLVGLSREQKDAVYLRLCWADSGEACNRLFVEDPECDIPETSPPVLEVVESEVFADDLLLDDFEAELGPGNWSADESDIEAVFEDLDGSDLELVFEEPGLEELAATESLAEPAVVVEEASFDLSEEPPEVFGEDIFDIEHGDETLQTEAVPDDTIDTFFDDLVDTEDSGDDICGVHVAEFAESGAAELVEEAPPVEPVSIAAGEDMSWCIPPGIQFSLSSPASGEIFAEFLDAFIEEGASELEKLEDAVARWESSPADEAIYTEVTRVLHTIKGIAKGVGLHYYGTLIHNFETLLDGVPRPQTAEEQGYFRMVNAWLDAAVRGIDHIREQRKDISNELPHVGGEQAGSQAIPEPQESVADMVEEKAPEPVSKKVQAAPSAAIAHRRELDKQLADEGARALAAQQSVRITSEKLDLLLNLTNQAHQLGVRTAQSTTRNKRNSAELQARLSSVRTHIADIADGALFNVASRGSGHSAELDALEMDQYTEIQEAANILREGVEDLAELVEIASRHNSQAEALLKQQATVISSIGSSIRAARVVPVSRLMPGLRRLVRTVSNDLDKDVAFRVANEVGTLDRDDYARCQTILEHMVRNALDHGIETAVERQALGKPSVGQITVDVRMSGADSVIVLSDDGRGIDPEIMREAALRKGLDVDVDALSDEEALGLIFHKGFSTAKSLSQVSGRGVGMDIVLSELQQMGGDVRIESESGVGTSFHIRIPSNVTVNGALLVTAGESSYAIPLGGLIAVDQLPVDDFFGAVERGDRLQISGLDCEPAYLGTLCQSGNLPDRNSWRATVPVIVAGSEQRYMAIAVDDVEEALELVIRSLGAQFSAVPGVAGAATTADGEAVVALDLNVLVACFAEGQGVAVTVEQPEDERCLALVVDDSRTQRMVATSQLETVGMETATAENGAVAIDWLNTTEHLPDVILLDVEMPVKDGIQTLREIRKSARYSHIPVIMVTSRTGVKHRTLAEEAGCSGYMGKPFNFRMLIGQINELTGQRLELG
jgi:chemotaxis protein histidine kinase CheA